MDTPHSKLSHIKLRLLLCACALVYCAHAPSADGTIDAETAQDHYRDARKAYLAEDYATFTQELEVALALNPRSLPTRYNLACGYARTGQSDKALEQLEKLAEQGADFDFANDEDLVSLRENPRFISLVKSTADFSPPTPDSEEYVDLGYLGLVPEGIAYDTATGRVFVGSMRTGNVYAIDASKRWSKFATFQSQGSMAAIGLTVDLDRHLLWAIGATFSLSEGYDAEAPARSGVAAFDLSSGELKKFYPAKAPKFGFNDVALGHDGKIYVSGDTLSMLASPNGSLQAIETSIPIYGSNGLAPDPTGKVLFVSSYPVGIAKVELASGETQWLKTPDSLSLYGIDGLYWHEGDLIGIQNGITPWRIVRLSLDASQSMVTDVQYIEFANPYATATTGAIKGSTLYYVGEGSKPEPVPTHFPEALERYAGTTIVMSVPLGKKSQ